MELNTGEMEGELSLFVKVKNGSQIRQNWSGVLTPSSKQVAKQNNINPGSKDQLSPLVKSNQLNIAKSSKDKHDRIFRLEKKTGILHGIFRNIFQ